MAKKVRTQADINIRKLSTAINKLPSMEKLPMSNIWNREVMEISGNKIKIKLGDETIQVDIMKMKDLEPDIQSAVLGALKQKRYEETQKYIVERGVQGVKFNKQQIKRFESRGHRYFREQIKKIGDINQEALNEIQEACGNQSTGSIENDLRFYVNNNVSGIVVTDNLFEYLYFQLYGADTYSRAELYGFIEWMDLEGISSLGETLWGAFGYEIKE